MNGTNMSNNIDDFNVKGDDVNSNDYNSDSESSGAFYDIIEELNVAVTSRTQWANNGKGFNRLEMYFTGKEYSVYQFKMLVMRKTVTK